MFGDAIQTLLDIKERYPEFTDHPESGRDIVAYRLALLWSTCPIPKLRNGPAAVKLARQTMKEKPNCTLAPIACMIAESLDGDPDSAEELEDKCAFVDYTRSPETIKRLVRLAVVHRRGTTSISSSDIKFLKQTRDNAFADYGGYSRQLAERIIAMIDNDSSTN